MTTLTVGPGATSVADRDSTRHSITYSSATAVTVSNGPVLLIPRDQLYYWSRAWQLQEAEAEAEIRAGKARHFESANEAIAWLLSGDE